MIKMTFEEWCGQLNRLAFLMGMKGSQSFAEDTGFDCWHAYYDEGLTPVDAMAEDATNA